MHFVSTIIGYLLVIPLLLFISFLVIIQSLLGNQKLFDKLLKYSCRRIPVFFGIKVKTFNLDNISPGKPYIFMANHVNIFDGFILYGYIPSFIRGVELESHFSWPVWGTITRKIGNIPISHNNPKAALKSLDKASKEITKGTSIIILPEGHRTRNGELQTFMRGPFRLAKKANVDIIPIAMKGLWDRKSVNSKIVHPGTVEFVVGNPITAESYKNISDRKLKDIIKNIIMGMLK